MSKTTVNFSDSVVCNKTEKNSGKTFIWFI